MLAVSLASLTACGGKSEECLVVDQREVSPTGHVALDGDGKIISDLSTLEYAKTSESALKSFTSIITDGASLADEALLPKKTAPSRKDYEKEISSIDTVIPFTKIHMSGNAPKITIVAESGAFKCSGILLWSAAGGSKVADVSCK
jgi:hypothetical protein